MMRILGTKWRTRTLRVMLATISSVTLLILLVVPNAQAVHDLGLFELDYVTTPVAQGDANVTDNGKTGTQAGDDWDKVFAGTSGAFSTVFIQDGTSPAQPGLPLDQSYFTGGSTKDPRDIGSNGAPSNCGTGDAGWQHTASDQAPDKDEIIDAFAAGYVDPVSGHTIFYFGLDRFDNSGDAQIGFWFYKSPVSEINPGGSGGFLGCHTAGNGIDTVGDILVLTDLVNGGRVGVIRVFEWRGGANPLFSLGSGQDCSVVGAGDRVCGVINNTAGENPPWDFENKNGESSYRVAQLFEAGIDLNRLLGETDIGCFASFLAETRSSQSTTAQLKDYGLGRFGSCNVSVTTEPSVGSNGTIQLGGGNVYDTATVKGTGGIGTPPVPEGTVAFFVCQPDELDSNGECSDDLGTQVGTPPEGEDLIPTGNPSESAADSEEYTPTVIGKHCWRAEYSGDDTYDATVDFDGATECFTVTDTSSVATQQDWLPNDTARITSAGGSLLSGDVVFELHESADCTGAAVYTETDTLTDASSPAETSTENADVYTADATVSWLVTFTSSNDVGSADPVCETSTLTIDNDVPIGP
jgi:hypothetical protein